MTTLNIILLLVAVTLSVIVFQQARLLWQEMRRHKGAPRKRPAQGTTENEADQILQRRIAEKAAAAAPTKPEEHIDLSESGAIFINDEIDRCIETKNWDDAVKWAAHAIQSRPDYMEFKIKLAEVYCQAGYRDEFTELFEELQQTLGEESDLRARLSAMAHEIIPDHDVGSK